MDIRFKTSCRAAGNHFILTKVTEAPENSHIEVACATCKDPTFPKFFKIGFDGGENACVDGCERDVNGEYVLVLPQADGGVQTVDFFAVDSAGNHVVSVSRRVSEFKYKWASRLNYKLHSSQVARIRNYDGYEAGRDTWFRIDDIIPNKDEGIYRGVCRIPWDCTGEARVECVDDQGVCWRDVVILKDCARTSPRDETMRYRELEFSIRLPLQPQLLEFVAVSDGEKLPGVKMLYGSEIAAMLQNSQKYVVTAQNDPAYNDWFAKHKASQAELATQRLTSFKYEPIFSIVVSVDKAQPDYVKAMIDSVVAQTYPYWQLVFVGAMPADEALADVSQLMAEGESRIAIVDAPQNRGMSEDLNAGIAAAAGDFICFLRDVDVLEPDCFYEYAQALNKDLACDVLYCDEDALCADGSYVSPFFKAPFSPAQLEARNYIGNFLTVRKSLFAQVGTFNPVYGGAAGYDLVLRIAEVTQNFVHISRVLHHARQNASTGVTQVTNESSAIDTNLQILQAHLDRLGVAAKAKRGALSTSYTVDYKDVFADQQFDLPLVSVIIPNKDASELLHDCVQAVYTFGGYANVEVIVVENNSTSAATFAMYEKLKSIYPSLRIVTWQGSYAGEFNFSAIVNKGVKEAHGDLLLLLNNDTRAITPGWIAQLAGGVMRDGVGIVGSKLYYADDTVQHAGVAVVNDVAGHVNLSLPRDAQGYFGSAVVSQNFSAVTAACLMVSRAVYEQVGGFDEELAVAFNDVDFCLKVRDAGLEVVFDASVELYHFESVSRGYEDTEAKMRRFTREVKNMRARWHKYYENGDPYINSNFIGKEGFNQYYGLPKE